MDESKKDIQTDKNETSEDVYTPIPMFDEFEDNGEFSPIVNDLFGVMS